MYNSSGALSLGSLDFSRHHAPAVVSSTPTNLVLTNLTADFSAQLNTSGELADLQLNYRLGNLVSDKTQISDMALEMELANFSVAFKI